MAERIFITVAVLILGSADLRAQSLRAQYLETKTSGLTKVYSDYVSELGALRNRTISSGTPEQVFSIDDEIKSVQEILILLEAGETVTHIEKFDDSQDQPGGRLRSIKNRCAERITKALELLDKQYIAKCDATIQLLLKQHKIDDARGLKEFRDGLVASRSDKTKIDLLADSKDWVEVKGEWKVDNSRAVGEGDSELLYSGENLPESFTLLADVRVKSGVRPRIYLGEYTVCNIDPRKFVLYPKQKTNLNENFYPWDHNKTYHVRIVYGPRIIELYIDDNLVEKHVEATAPVKRLALSAGDYYSKGEVVFSNVLLRKGL